METFIILLATSFFATLLSSMSGGGASAIVVPVMLWLGIPFPLATATQKISAVFWVVPAAYNYLRDTKIDWRFLLGFSVLGMLGVYTGYLLIITIEEAYIKRIVGAIILTLVLYTFLKKELGVVPERVTSRLRRAVAFVVAPLLGFYECIFGSGNGILFSILTLRTRGFDFTAALGYYYAIAFFWCAVAAGLLVSTGFFDTSVVAPVVIGSVAGGYTGSRYAKYKGNKFIRMMFVIIGAALGIKLILGF